MRSNNDLIAMHFAFLRDGCAAMAGNIAELLTMAGEPITTRNVILVLKSLPVHHEDLKDPIWRESFLSKILKRTFDRRDKNADRDQHQRFVDYFLVDIPRRSSMTMDLLGAAFEGALSIDIQPDPGFELVPEAPSIRFPCPGCGKTFAVYPALAGKNAECKACRASMTIPEETQPC